MDATDNIIITIKTLLLSLSIILLIFTLHIYRILPQLRKLLVSSITKEPITSIHKYTYDYFKGHFYIEYACLWNSYSIYETQFAL